MYHSEYTANVNKFSFADTTTEQRAKHSKPVAFKSKLSYLGMIKTLVSVVLVTVIVAELVSLNIVLF